MGVDCEATREVRAQLNGEVVAQTMSEPQATTCLLQQVIVACQWFVAIRRNLKSMDEEDGKGL